MLAEIFTQYVGNVALRNNLAPFKVPAINHDGSQLLYLVTFEPKG